MSWFPERAPIPYEDLRHRYNTVRGLAALGAAVASVVLSIAVASPAFMTLGALGLVVAADSWVRYSGRGGVYGSLVLDATVIGVAMYLRGPSPAVHSLAVMALLVTGALLLPARRAGAIVVYATAWSAAVTLISSASPPGLGAMVDAGIEEHVDRAMAILLMAVTAALLFQAVRVILTAQDRQHEALERERRAVQLKNEFVSMVSHELRTPLTGISGFTETLAQQWMSLTDEEIDEFLTIMHNETEHLSNLVEDILVIPRLEAGRLPLHRERLDLATECHAVAAMVFPDTDYSVSVPTNVTVDADRMRLRQIMRNLLENARKYGGDQVLIEAELDSPGLYAVSVSDNGAGVAVEDQERIFEHFEQLSKGDARIQQGVGLGLPIARRLARAMGGDLWYEDRFPVGARFSFTLPIAGETSTDREASALTHAVP